MPKSPFQDWLSTQEYRRRHAIFLVEWLAIFAIAWLFWWVMFVGGRGAVPPGLAATITSGLYATCIIYGRLLRVTGCRRCRNPMPFMRREVGRRHLQDQEDCIELEYGGDEWDQHYVHVHCRVVRSDIVTYRCRNCDQVWEEKLELPGSGYKQVDRMDLNK